MMQLYKPNIDFISEHAVDPDMRRYAIAEEGPRHYIDIDHYGPYPFNILQTKIFYRQEMFLLILFQMKEQNQMLLHFPALFAR